VRHRSENEQVEVMGAVGHPMARWLEIHREFRIGVVAGRALQRNDAVADQQLCAVADRRPSGAPIFSPHTRLVDASKSMPATWWR
jgi:hypothetical protein